MQNIDKMETVCRCNRKENAHLIAVILDKDSEHEVYDTSIRRAHWKGAGMGDYYCSWCCGQYSGGNRFHFCPNCGAAMILED